MVTSMIADRASIGMAKPMAVPRQLTQINRAPAASGAMVSPRLAPVPCMAMAKPRRSANSLDRYEIAGGCHMLMQVPVITSMLQIKI